MRRSLIAVVVILIILALAWAGGWFWLSGWADRQATNALEELARNGVEIECQSREIVGFPFAMQVRCADTAVVERSTDTRASLPGLTGGASVFAPSVVKVDMASPAAIESRLLGGTAGFQWESAALGVGMGVNGPRDVSFDTANVQAEIAVPALLVEKVAADSAEGTLAPSSNGGTSVAITFSNARISMRGFELPAVTGSAAGELSVPPRALLSGRAGMQAPVTARAIDIDLSSGGARLKAEGEIALDAEGVLNGMITLRVAGAEQIPAVIASLPPAWQKLGNVVAGGLFAFGTPTTLDGASASELTLQIDNGNASIGLIQFTLPRVPL